MEKNKIVPDSNMVVPFNEHPHKLKKGGRVKGKGIKGYIEGGTVDGPIPAKKNRTYSTKASDYLRDTALGIADYSLAPLAPNAIKSTDYNTKWAATEGNNASAIYGQGIKQIGGGVLNYYAPGLGTGINAGTDMVANLAGDDKGITDKTKKTIDTTKVVGSLGSAGVSSISGQIKSNKQKTKDALTPSSIPSDTKEPDNSTKPIDYVSMLDGEYLSNYNAAQTDEERQAVLNSFISDRMSQGKANGGKVSSGKNVGGKIVGAGTAKSDSIKAKANSGDFIVPAENAKEAEKLREKYLSGRKDQVASKNAGNVDVKLSNGEHKFTMEEYNFLKAKGIDVDALAPNAEDKNEKADGGGIDENTPSRKESSGNDAADKIIDDIYAGKFKTKKDLQDALSKVKTFTGSGFTNFSKSSEYRNVEAYVGNKINEFDSAKSEYVKKSLWQKAQNDAAKKLKDAGASDSEIADYKKKSTYNPKFGIQGTQGPSAQADDYIKKVVNKSQFENSVKAVDDEIKKRSALYQDTQKNPDKYSAEQIKYYKDSLNDFVDLKDQLSQSRSDEDWTSGISLANKKFKSYNIGSNYGSGVSESGNGGDITPKEGILPKIAKDSSKNPFVPISDSSQTSTSKGYTNASSNNATTDNVVTTKKGKSGIAGKDMVTMAPLQTKLNEAKVNLPETLPYNTAGDVTPVADVGKKNYLKPINADFGTGLGLAQIGLGAESLINDGKRPVGTIDPDFLNAVETAKKEANYGLSPRQMAIGETNIEKNRRADIQNIVNLSGGSAGTALGNIKSASISADNAINNLAAESENLKLNKERYAATLADEKASKSRQLFEDKLNAFNQNQMAGASLVGAGIENAIGSNRFNSVLKDQQSRNSMYGNNKLPGIEKKSDIRLLAGQVPSGTTDVESYYRNYAKSRGFNYDTLTND